MASLLDVFNSAASLGQVFIGASEKQLKEEAEAALSKQNLDMQRFMADEMQKFSVRSDYENFADEWNSDFERVYGSYNGNGQSAYKNQYTAKLGNQMLSQYKLSGDIAMQKMIQNGRRNAQDADWQNQIAELSNRPATQERMNGMAAVYQKRFESGLDTAQQYEQNMRNAYNTTQAEAATGWLYNEIQTHPELMNETDEALSNKLMSKSVINAAMHLPDGRTVELSTNRRAVNDEAVKQTRLKVRSDWQKTDTQLTAEYSDIDYAVAFDSGANADALTQRITSQIQKIRGLNGSQLSDEMKLSQIKRLEALLSPLTQSGSKSSGTSSAREAAFTAAIKDRQADIVEAIIRGKQNDTQNGIVNFNNGKIAFIDACRKLYADNGKSTEEFERDYGKLVSDFTLSWKKRIGEEYPDLIRQIDKIAKIPDEWKKKEPFKSNPDLAADLEPELTEFLWDFTAGNDFRKVNAESMRAQIDDYLNRMTSKTFDYLEANSDKARKSYTKDKGFARAISAAGTDLIFTDIFGKTHAIGGSDTEERLKNLNAWQKRDLAATLGTDAIGELGYEETDGGNDRNSTMIYEVNKKAYKYGVNEKGTTPILYEKQKNGEWKEVPRIKNAVKEAEAKEKRDVKAESKTTTLAEKAAKVESRITHMLSSGFIPYGYTKETWNALSDKQKRAIVEKYANY